MISAIQFSSRGAMTRQPVAPQPDRSRAAFDNLLSSRLSAPRGNAAGVASSRRPVSVSDRDLPAPPAPPPAPAATQPQIVVSPFNPLGLPVATTPAPTAAEVAADPARFAGTSFDPNRRIEPLVVRMRQLEAMDGAARWREDLPPQPDPAAEAARRAQQMQPPAGARATNDPNVFVVGQGTFWNRPGTVPVHASSEDYQRWVRSVFGA